MKKLLLILLISFLFQSCFSYKSADYNSIETDKKQKIEVEMLDRTSFKGQLVSKDETTMILENNGSTQTILKEEIYEVKVKTFSILKTAGNVGKTAGWLAAGVGVIVVIALSSGDVN